MILMFLSLNDVNSSGWTVEHFLQCSTIKPERMLANRKDAGGAYRDRTDDLLNANQALSQLS